MKKIGVVRDLGGTLAYCGVHGWWHLPKSLLGVEGRMHVRLP